MIRGCESTARLHTLDGKRKLAAAATARAEEYRAELAARERGERVQEAQEDHRRDGGPLPDGRGSHDGDGSGGCA
jgi:hypothetical protein